MKAVVFIDATEE